MGISSTVHQKGSGTDKRFTTKIVDLEPNQTKQVAVGSYSKAEHQPTFSITTTPDIGEQLGASFERLDVPGMAKYVAFYHLQNYSNQPCKVTIASQA